MTSLVKNGLVLIGLILVGGLGYYLFVIKGDSATLVGGERINDAKLTSDQFLRQLNEIKSYDLSGDVLRDERFRSLVDFTEPIVPQPIGRENPFAPVLVP